MLTTETRRQGSAARVPVRHLVGAVLRDDDDAAFEVTERVLRRAGSRTAVFADLLHPAQVEVGDLWYRGQVSFTDEVRVAAAIRRLVDRLPPTPVARPVRPGTRCMLAVPHGDPHDLGLTMLMLALQDHGWSIEAMGPANGLGDLADMVAARRPRFFGLSAGYLPPLPQVERAISVIRRAQVPVLVGGPAFIRRPDLWRRVGADGLGTDVRVGVVLAQRFAGR